MIEGEWKREGEGEERENEERVGEMYLSSANVGSGLLSTNVLLAGLEGHAKRRTSLYKM